MVGTAPQGLAECRHLQLDSPKARLRLQGGGDAVPQEMRLLFGNSTSCSRGWVPVPAPTWFWVTSSPNPAVP